MFRYLFFAMLIVRLTTVFCSVGESQILSYAFEGTGDVVRDCTGNEHHGMIVGSKRVDGKYGKGISIGKADQFVQIDNSKFDVLQPTGTIEFWFKPNWDGNDAESYRLFDATATGTGGDGGSDFWFIGKGFLGERQTELGFFFEDATSTDFLVSTAAADVIKNAGEWYHIAATWNKKEAKFYVSGEELASVTGFGDFIKPNPKPKIGGNTGGKDAKNGADSVIDEFVIYEKALGVDEIKRDMNVTFSSVELSGKLPIMWGYIKSRY